MRITKGNTIACKRIKGGRAGCWIRKGGRRVFRFVSPKTLSGLGIPIVSAGQAIKLLPGLAGAKGSRTRTGKGLGVTFDGEHCRDSEGKFVPVLQCTGRGKAKGRKKTTRKRKS